MPIVINDHIYLPLSRKYMTRPCCKTGHTIYRFERFSDLNVFFVPRSRWRMSTANCVRLGSTFLDDNLFIFAYDNRKTDRSCRCRLPESNQLPTNFWLSFYKRAFISIWMGQSITWLLSFLPSASFVLMTSHYSHPLLVGCDSEQLVRGGSQKKDGGRQRKAAMVDSPIRGGLVIIYSKGVSPISQCFRCSSPTMDQR